MIFIFRNRSCDCYFDVKFNDIYVSNSKCLVVTLFVCNEFIDKRQAIGFIIRARPANSCFENEKFFPISAELINERGTLSLQID